MTSRRERVEKYVEYTLHVPCSAGELGRALSAIHQELGPAKTAWDDCYEVDTDGEYIILRYPPRPQGC